MGLVLGSCKMSRFLHLLHQNLKVYIDALTGYSHAYYLDSLSTTFLSQVCILGAASGNRESKWNIPKDRGRVGSVQVPSSTRGLTGGHISVTSPTPLPILEVWWDFSLIFIVRTW